MNNAFAEPDAELDSLAHKAIGAAIDVHRSLGPGFAEAVYEAALCVELGLRQLPFARQAPFEITYKGEAIGQGRLDVIVGGRLIVELKAVELLMPVHMSQVRSYLKATGCTLGLLINFNVPRLPQGIRRIIESAR